MHERRDLVRSEARARHRGVEHREGAAGRYDTVGSQVVGLNVDVKARAGRGLGQIDASAVDALAFEVVGRGEAVGGRVVARLRLRICLGRSQECGGAGDNDRAEQPGIDRSHQAELSWLRLVKEPGMVSRNVAEADFFRDAAKQSTARSVKRVEEQTSAEVVVAVRRRSGDYRVAAYHFGLFVGAAVVLYLLVTPQVFSVADIA